jgi:hypothetical protein
MRFARALVNERLTNGGKRGQLTGSLGRGIAAIERKACGAPLSVV